MCVLLSQLVRLMAPGTQRCPFFFPLSLAVGNLLLLTSIHIHTVNVFLCRSLCPGALNCSRHCVMLLEHVCFAFFELEWSLDRSPGSLTTDKFETLSTDAASRQVEPSWEAQLIPIQYVHLIKNPVMAAAD